MTWFIAFLYGAALFFIHRFFPFTVLFVFLCLAGVLAKYRKLPALPPVLFLFALTFTALCGFFYAKLFTPPALPLAQLAGETITVKGTARAEAVHLRSRNDAYSSILDVESSLDNSGSSLAMREIRIISDTALQPGRVCDVVVNVPADAYSLNPGSNTRILRGYAVKVMDRGPAPTNLFTQARLRLNHFMSNNFSAESAPFLMSIITGERGLLTPEMNRAFNVTGLAHILSISGAHFGLLLFILFRFLKILIKALPYRLLVRMTLYVTPSQVSALLSLPVIACYYGISDMSFPAVRSFIMITLFLAGLLVNRKGAWLNTLLFAAVIIVNLPGDFPYPSMDLILGDERFKDISVYNDLVLHSIG